MTNGPPLGLFQPQPVHPNITMTTIGSALRAAIERLTSSSTPRLDAQWLLSHALDVPTTTLAAWPERTLTPEQARLFDDLIAQRAAGMPVAYLLGRVGFYGLDLRVTPDVLIPRPETELLVEQAIALAGERACTVADIGTGSGAIPIAVGRHCPGAGLHAVDISPAALAVARANAEAHAVSITFWQGDLAQPLIEGGIQVELLLANLPYIATDEIPQLAVSRYEPHLALDGGLDGLDLIRRLLAQVPLFCTSQAHILLEIGAGQGPATGQIAQAMLNPAHVEIIPDYAGHDRIVVIHR